MDLRIVCAANQITTPTCTYYILGVRHFDALMWVHLNSIIDKIDDESLKNTEQGFIDNKGNFHTREKAWIIANEANQVIRRVGGDEGKLYSENLY